MIPTLRRALKALCDLRSQTGYTAPSQGLQADGGLMTPAQHNQLGVASEPRPERRRLTAHCTGALTAPGEPQVDFPVQLVLQKVFAGFRLGTVPAAAARAVAGTAGGSLALNHHHVPLAFIESVCTHFRDKHCCTW